MKRFLPWALQGLVALAAASATASVHEYAVVPPGACIVNDTNTRARWMEAVGQFEASAYEDAQRSLAACLAACPNDVGARHLAALCLWASGDRSAAIRRLVQLQQQTTPPAAVYATLAALHAEGGVEAGAVGWLRKGLGSLDAGEKAYWVSRDAFARLWRPASEQWTAFLREIGISADLSVARAMAVRPVPDETNHEPEPAAARALLLSPFNPNLDSIEQAGQLRKMVEQRLVDRIRLPMEIPITEDVIEENLQMLDEVLEQP